MDHRCLQQSGFISFLLLSLRSRFKHFGLHRAGQKERRSPIYRGKIEIRRGIYCHQSDKIDLWTIRDFYEREKEGTRTGKEGKGERLGCSRMCWARGRECSARAIILNTYHEYKCAAVAQGQECTTIRLGGKQLSENFISPNSRNV